MLHVTGGWYGGDDDYRNDDILEAQGGGWRKVGKLTNRRSATGISVVNFNDFTNYCKN